MDILVKADIEADNQESYPYNVPEAFDESSYSYEFYVRGIQEIHYSELISLLFEYQPYLILFLKVMLLFLPFPHLLIACPS